MLTSFFSSPGSAPYCSAHQTKWLEHCFVLATGWQLCWACPRLGNTRATSLNGLDSFLLPRGLPSCDSVFEGQQPSYTPGSYFGPSFKDCDGNWQNTASSVHVMEGQDVTGTHLSAGCVHMCGCECVHDGGVAISRDQMSFVLCP